jgi:hypothetical protein
MQKTANQIKSEFELLASGHYQIHSFLYAQEFEQQAYENLIYPLMLVYPLGGSLSGTSYTRNYRVVIADRVLKSEGNELEVESDTQLIALDTLAYWMKLGTNERFSITSSNTITPFWEKWGDEVTGHFVDIGIEEFYDFNSCAIPLSSAIPSPTNPCKDARILINSVIYGNAPSDTNFNVVVKDQLGALVGSLIGGEWIVNTGGSCADATYTITNSTGTTLYTGTIPSGGTLTQAISNSTLNVNNSTSTLISSRSILAQGTSSYNVADSIAVIKDSAGTTLKSENILATASENITINNSSVNVNKSDGTLISAVSVKAENTASYNVGDSSAVLKDESSNVLSTTPIKATESKDITAPNGDVSVNSVAFDDVLSGGTLNIQVRKSTGNDLIGSKQGQYWRIGNSTAVIKDSANNTLKSEAIMATETENIVVNDSVAVIKNSVGTTLKSENILAQATENITINDSTAVIKDSIGTTLKTEPILAEATENITINNSLVNVRKSDNVLINAVSVKAENTENYLVADSTITNAAISPTYSQLVKATEGLILPTQTIQNNGVASGFIPSVGTINVTTNAAPTSFTITGRTIDIVVPSGGTPMDVDFSADKLTANIGETITFTDLSDQTPTHWSWRFDTEGVSELQNPNFIFNTKGFKNITLLAGKVGAGNVEIKSNYLEILFEGILDIYTTADLAFSLRKLRLAYTGNCIRVRRSSDNTEQDIGFNSSDTLDTVSLLTFVGAGNGFVTKWYDQSGNTRDITQTTAAQQPQIVSSGVVLTRNGLPCVRYSGSSINMGLLTSATYSVPVATTFSSVLTPLVGAASYRYIFTIGTTAASSPFHAFCYRAGGTQEDWITEDALYFGNGFGVGRNPRLISNGQQFLNGGQYVTFGTINSTLNILDVNNSVSTTRVNNAAALPTQSGIFRLGNSSINGEQLSGDIQEFILWGNNLTSDKSGIISNTNNFYNVF